jgi:hypothetical protein
MLLKLYKRLIKPLCSWKEYCYPIALVLSALLYCHKSPVKTNQPEDIPPLTNRKILIQSVIPYYVRLDTLTVKGTALEYDTVICDTRDRRVRGAIGDSGSFSIRVPISINRKNSWLLFAKDRYSRSSDTTVVTFTHTLSDSIRLFDKPPRYTNQGTLTVKGEALGFSTVTCTGGAETTRSAVVQHGFEMAVSLKHNAANRLSIFAVDSLGVISDTLVIETIHDDIPPALVRASVETDSVSYPIYEPLTFEFDCPLLQAGISIEIQPSYTVYPDLVWAGAGSFHASAVRLTIGREYALTVQALDSARNRFTAGYSLKTYRQKLHPGNTIEAAWMSQLSDRLYALTTDPKSLVVVDTHSWQILKTVRLSYPPTSGAENPHNGMVYVTSRSTGYITVVDLDRQKESKFLLPASEYPLGAEPTGIAFSPNGMGIVQTEPWQIRMIDSRDNDKIDKHPDFDRAEASYPMPVAYNRHENFVLAGMGSSTADFYSYDYSRNAFKRLFENTDFGYCHTAVGHAFRPVFAFQVGRDSYILDGEDQLFGPVPVERPYTFTNRPGEDHYLYYCGLSGVELGVYDVEKKAEILSAPLGCGATTLLAARDGDVLVLVDGQNGDMTVVDRKTFRR